MVNWREQVWLTRQEDETEGLSQMSMIQRPSGDLASGYCLGAVELMVEYVA